MKQRYTGRRSVFGDLENRKHKNWNPFAVLKKVFSRSPVDNRIFKNGRAKATRHRLAQRDNDIKLYPYKYVVE